MIEFFEWIKNRTNESSYTMNWDDLDNRIDSGSDDHETGIHKNHPDRLPYEDNEEEKHSPYYLELSKKRQELKKQLKDLEAQMIRIVQMRDRV